MNRRIAVIVGLLLLVVISTRVYSAVIYDATGLLFGSTDYQTGTAPTTGQVVSLVGGVLTGASTEMVMNVGPDVFGNATGANGFATGQQLQASKAAVACHFTSLNCVNIYHAATCTTAPTVNVFDGGTNTGTAIICAATLQSTRGTITTQAETQAVAAGDIYGIYVSTAGGTCLTDEFVVSAELSCP